MLSREWRCIWSSGDRRCSNYIWTIDNFIAHQGASYIRDLTLLKKLWKVITYPCHDVSKRGPMSQYGILWPSMLTHSGPKLIKDHNHSFPYSDIHSFIPHPMLIQGRVYFHIFTILVMFRKIWFMIVYQERGRFYPENFLHTSYMASNYVQGFNTLRQRQNGHFADNTFKQFHGWKLLHFDSNFT